MTVFRPSAYGQLNSEGAAVPDSRPASMPELHAMPGHLLRRAQQISAALFAEECGRWDLTSVQYAAMVAIHANPRLDATRLSVLIAFDRSTMGNVLERLEGKGWVVRSGSRDDRRVKLLALTPQGRRVLEEVGPAIRRVQERLLAPLEGDERAAMVALLTRLVDLHGDVTAAPMRAAG